MEEISNKIWEIQEGIYSQELKALKEDIIASIAREAATPTAPVEAPKTEKKYKWGTSLDSTFKFDFEKAVPLNDLNKVDWASTKGVERSDSGAEGVFFIQTGSGAVVVKGSKSMASEVFATLLEMYFGVNVPRFRVIKTDTEEGLLMLSSLKKADPTWRVVSNLFDLSYVLLKEYLHGKNLSSLSYERACEIFGKNHQLSEEGKKRLHEIGTLVAIDLLVNNGDRLPTSVWGNQGNAGNVMFSKGPGVLISVDSQLFTINRTSYPEQVESYLKKVDNFLRSICENDPNALLALSGTINNFSRYDINEEATSYIRKGILDTVKKACSNNLSEQMKSWKEVITKFSPPLVGIEKVDVEFVEAVLGVFKSYESKI